MAYYSAIKKKEFLQFVTTWVDLEGIMLSKISQREKDRYCVISHMCKKTELIETESRLVVARGEVGEMGEGYQKVQTSNYKINKFWECNVQPSN